MFNQMIVHYLKRFFTLVFLAAILYNSSVILKAQDTRKDTVRNSIENTRPNLNGHEFISTTPVEGPFVNTQFRLSAGIGSSSNYDYPLVIRGQEVKGLFGQITFASLYVHYQQNIKDWMAFLVTVNMKGRLGSQTISLLTEGANIGTSFNFGWLFKAVESKKFMLSAGMNISSQSLTVFNMYDFIDKVIENGEITPDNRLVKTTNITAGTLGLRTAYSFSRTFGCIGKVSFGYGESVSSVNRGYFDAGISFDANLNPKLSVPIGFALGYNWNNYNQDDISFSNPQNIIFKLNYTGRKDFDLGAEMITQFFSYKRGDQNINMQVLFMNASIAYYF